MKRSLGILGCALVLAGIAYGIWRLIPPREAVSILSGTIEADEVRVASRYGGRVVKVAAVEGQWLKEGELIVELAADELKAQRQQAAAVVEELEAGARSQELEAARQEWEAVKAELDLAKSELRRMRTLFDQKGVPESDFERAASRAGVIEKKAASAQSHLDLLQAGTRPERINQAKAHLREIEARVAELQVRAPSPAFLEVLHVRVGDVLSANREVAALLLPTNLWVKVYVPEPWLGAVKMGQKVSVLTSAFPGREFPGEIMQISRQAEFTPRNIQTAEDRVKQVFAVKVRLPNGEGALRAGMSAEVRWFGAPPIP